MKIGIIGGVSGKSANDDCVKLEPMGEVRLALRPYGRKNECSAELAKLRNLAGNAGENEPQSIDLPQLAPSENAPDLINRGRSLDLEHETGLASACRFAAGALR
jgi:hypothetical protein